MEIWKEERTKRANTWVLAIDHPSFEFCRIDWMIEMEITRLAGAPDDDFYKGRSKRDLPRSEASTIQSGIRPTPVDCAESHVEYVIFRTSLRRL